MPKVSIESTAANSMGVGTAGKSFGYSLGANGQTHSQAAVAFGNFLNNPTAGSAARVEQTLGSAYAPMFQGFVRTPHSGPGSIANPSLAIESLSMRRFTRALGSGEPFAQLPRSTRRDFTSIRSGTYEGAALSQGISVQGFGGNQKLGEIAGLLRQILQVDRAELGAIVGGVASTPAAMGIGVAAAATAASPAAAIGAAPAFVPPAMAPPSFVPPNIGFPNWPTAGRGRRSVGGGGQGGGGQRPPTQPAPRAPRPPPTPRNPSNPQPVPNQPQRGPHNVQWGRFWALRHAMTQAGRIPGIGTALGPAMDIGELGYAAGMSLTTAGVLGGATAGAIAAFNPNYIGGALLQSAMAGAQPYMSFVGNINTLAMGQGNASRYSPFINDFYTNQMQSQLTALGLSPQEAAGLAAQSPIMGPSLSVMRGFNYAQARKMIGSNLIPGFQNLSPAALTNALNQQLIFGAPTGLNNGGLNPLSVLSTIAAGANPGLYPGAITSSLNILSNQTATMGGGINRSSLIGFSSAVQRSGFAGAQNGIMQGQISNIMSNSYQGAFGNPFTAQTMIFGLRNITSKTALDSALGLTSQDYAQDPGLANAVSQYLAARHAGSPVAYGWFQRIIQLTSSNKTAQGFMARAGQSYLNTIAPNAPSYMKQFLAPQFAGFGNNYPQFLGGGIFIYPQVNAMTLTNKKGIGGAANAFNIPSNLLTAVLLQEHHGNLTKGSGWASSPAGALGIGQLMPSTAADMYFGTGAWGRMTPQQQAAFKQKIATNDQLNLTLSAKYFSQMMTEFHGDVFKAAEAYNAGPGAVENNFAGWNQSKITAVKQYATNVQEYYRELNNNVGNIGVGPKNVSPDLQRVYQYKTRLGQMQLGSAMRVFHTLVPLFNRAADLAQQFANIEKELAGAFESAAPNMSDAAPMTSHNTRMPNSSP